MKSIFLKKTSYDSDPSLPPIIKLTQYNSALAQAYVSNISSVDSYSRVGNIGNGYFDFSFDFYHPEAENSSIIPSTSINPKPANNIAYINNIITNKKFPILRKKEDILDRFFVIEISDYGCQAMSPFYRDFVPQVYVNGYKIWQMYIGMIRQYSNKKAFICIDKNAIKDGGPTAIVNEIIVRICFKNNIENKFDDQNNITLTEKYNENTKIISLTATTNFIFLSKNNIRDFQLYYDDTLVPNDMYFYTLEETLANNSSDVAKQTTDDGSKAEDYFKQAFLNDYQTKDEKEVYYRPEAIVNLKITLSSTKDLNKTWTLKSRQNNLMAYYLKDTGLSCLPIFSVTRPEDINIFDADGSKVEAIDDTNSTSIYEVVPEYDNIRKYEFRITKPTTSTTVMSQAQMLYDNFIYPYNREKAETLIYRSGLLIYADSSTEYSDAYNKNDDVIIYDSGDKLDKKNKKIEKASGTEYSNINWPNSVDGWPSIVLADSNETVFTDPYLISNEAEETFHSTNIYPYNKDADGLRLDSNEPYYIYVPETEAKYGLFLNKDIDGSFSTFKTYFEAITGDKDEFSEVVAVDANYEQLEKNLYDNIKKFLTLKNGNVDIQHSNYKSGDNIIFQYSNSKHTDPGHTYALAIFYNDDKIIKFCEKIPLIDGNKVGIIFINSKNSNEAEYNIFIPNSTEYCIF